jgi:predicted ArsR family transcriptional regulator
VQPVRRRIAEILKEQGSATVAELADELGMAQVSVRHHLDILVGEDLVESAGVRRRDGAGRPSQIYALTPAADQLFPHRHDALAGDILSEMKAILPGVEVRGVFLRMAEKASHEAPARIPGQALEQRLNEVTSFLTKRGYNARWEVHDGRYAIYACNCPYSGVSHHHHELCLMDQALMEHLIPGVVRVESQALDGASHCTYVIESIPASGESA